MPYYLNPNINGLIIAESLGDGYSIKLKFATAYTNNKVNKILYNIYMSDDVAPDFSNDFFLLPPTYVSFDGYSHATIVDLDPGSMYHFAVRAAEYNPSEFNPSTLPQINGLGIIPQSLLAADISATDTIIPLIDAEQYPSSGTVKIGAELIYYTSINSNDLLVPGGTSVSAHFVDQGGGNFYLPAAGNIGAGIINNMSIISPNAKTETWTIKCISVQRNNSDAVIPGTANFEAIGSLSGSIVDPPFDGYQGIWNVYDQVVTNGIISFSIQENDTFALGDSFVIKVFGSVDSSGGRGYNGSIATEHTTDGYDGYCYWNPSVIYFPPEQEEQNTRVYECWNRFDVGHYPFTITDGYRQKTIDNLTTDLSYSDSVNTGFPAYDFAGYHRTDPVMLFSGGCIGSYIGGYMYCADGYSGVGRQLRGLPIQTLNMQRQEVLLSTTGEPVILVQRNWTGITCKCMLPNNEYPSARCPNCLGSGLIIAWAQYFNPRRSDGKIMVRFDPAVDDLAATDSGLESEMKPSCWTIPIPSIKDRSILIRFDEDGNEEFRYEVLNVTRNKLLLNQTGVQKFTLQRVRKTDIIYQIPIQVI